MTEKQHVLGITAKYLQLKTRFFARWTNFLESSGFFLVLSAWKETDPKIIYSILISSLTISLLMLLFPLTLLQIYDRVIPNASINTLFWLTLIVIGSQLLIAILKILRVYLSSWADVKYEHFLACDAFNKILNCHLAQYEIEGGGRHLKRMHALNLVKQFYAGQALLAMVDVPFVFIFLFFIAYIGKTIVVIPLVIIAVTFYIIFNNTQVIKSLLKKRHEQDGRRLNFIVEIISKLATIKSNTIEAQMLRRFERLQKRSTFYDYKLTQRSAYLLSDNVLFSQLIVVLIVAYGGVQVFSGSLSLGALAACTLLAGQCMQPVNNLISIWSRLQTIKIAHKELTKILTMKSEKNASDVQVKLTSGKIEFQNVCFCYEGTDLNKKQILKDCNLTVLPNDIISIEGDRSSGKSTLLFLILKLISPSEGRILIDGKNILHMDPNYLRTQIAYLPQQATLFKGSILDNLTLFQKEYQKKALELSKQIGLEKFIEYFPQGYETKVASQTTEALPRGMQQQIVIVRALIRDSPIILFDEGNLTLDMEGDKNFRDLLDGFRDLRTIILISHRPSIIALANRNYILEEGRLREGNAKSISF